MSDALHPGRRVVVLRVFVPCVCLGLLFVVSVGAGAQAKAPEEPTQDIHSGADSDQPNTEPTLIFQVPEGFVPVGGEARLVVTRGDDCKAVVGTFAVEAQVATTNLKTETGWKPTTIELEGQPFLLSGQEVGPTEPQELTFEPDPLMTTQEDQVFRVLSGKALEKDAKLCGARLRSGQEKLRFKTHLMNIGEAGLDVRLAVKRPEAKVTDARLFLTVCRGSTCWIYQGKLSELSPAEPSPFVFFWRQVEARPWLSSGIALGLLCLFGYVTHGAYDLWRQRRPSPDPAIQLPSEPSQSLPPFAAEVTLSLEAIESRISEVLNRDLTPLKEDIKAVRSSLADIEDRLFYFPMSKGAMETLGGRDTVPSDPAPFMGGGDGNLSELVNRWWREGSDRSRAEQLTQSPFVNVYRSVNIKETLRNSVDRTFVFQSTSSPMEWLGRQHQQGELLLVPCDQRQFETGDSLKFLGNLFEGLGKSLAKVRFRRVVRPCRLRREPGSQDRYRLVEKGLLELEGHTETASAPLVVQPVAVPRVPQEGLSAGFSETKLVRVVREAVSDTIPRELPGRVEELSQLIRSWRDRAQEKAEYAPPDPGLAAALDSVQKSLAVFEARLQAQAATVQEVKGLVEALRGDLHRIRAEFRQADTPPNAVGKVLITDPIEESEIDAAMDRLREVPAQRLAQGSRLASESWRPTEPVHVPQSLLARLAPWWPERLLPPPDSGPDGGNLPDPSAYLWRLEETQRVLLRACREKGWQVSLVHLSVPEGTAQSDSLLEILEPVTVSGDYRLAFYRGNPFNDALLFQFALSIHGDDSKDIAVLPAAGLRVDRHHHAYSRLTLGNLPSSAVKITQVHQPAVLSQAGQGGLYTVVSPLKADFR